MSDLTRRSFMQKAALGAVAGAAGVGALASAATEASAREAATTTDAGHASTGPEPVMAYVRAGQYREVTVLVGDREIVRRDPDLARRLLRAAK